SGPGALRHPPGGGAGGAAGGGHQRALLRWHGLRPRHSGLSVGAGGTESPGSRPGGTGLRSGVRHPCGVERRTCVKSLIIAFAMYSKIPMPRVDWEKKALSWALCWFPLVGAVIGAVLYGWMALARYLGFG